MNDLITYKEARLVLTWRSIRMDHQVRTSLTNVSTIAHKLHSEID